MVQSQFSLTWESYKSSICSGFSSLQQNGEFVDMTLAADGHLVKVHQILLALASPYLKELISSAPCQHPVIFLNNVSHTTLGLLLEYIYTGEVLVPSKHLQAFMDTAKALHVKGLESISSNYSSNEPSQLSDNNVPSIKSAKKETPLSDIHPAQIDLPQAARKIFIKHETQADAILSVRSDLQIPKSQDSYHTFGESMDITNNSDSDDDDTMDSMPTTNKSEAISQDKVSSSNLQFTVSIRGSLQVILNRYMYNLHSMQNTGIRRWRCTDYRNKKCMASLVTKGNVVLNRSNLHNHSFHDKKILGKIEKNAVYSALADVEVYRDKERAKSIDQNWSLESPAYVSIDCSSDLNDESNSKPNQSSVK